MYENVNDLLRKSYIFYTKRRAESEDEDDKIQDDLDEILAQNVIDIVGDYDNYYNFCVEKESNKYIVLTNRNCNKLEKSALCDLILKFDQPVYVPQNDDHYCQILDKKHCPKKYKSMIYDDTYIYQRNFQILSPKARS